MAKKVVKKKENKIQENYDLISYIIGIVAIVQAFITPSAGVVLSIIGLVFSNKLTTSLGKKAKRLNLAALIIGAAFFILVMILSFTSVAGNYLQ